jgi:transposase
MNDYTIGAEKLAELRAAHRGTRNKREADRIKAVVLLATGWSAEQVAEVLQVDPNTVRNHFRRYRQGGIKALGHVAFRGSVCALDAAQLAVLDAHLQTHLYQTAKAVACWVEDTFEVDYTESGMTALLHRLGYVYKKPKVVPGKADPEAQRAFLEQYEKLKQDKGQEDPIYFMDATHPQHNPVIACGWIKRGEEHAVRTNTGRQRVNINADSTIALFEQLERVNLLAARIYVICDNARYYRSKAVKEYVKTSRITLVFLPPYAPNLNLIERLWKLFKKQTLYNRYFETFADFKAACEEFFANPGKHHRELRSLLTESFEIVG